MKTKKKKNHSNSHADLIFHVIISSKRNFMILMTLAVLSTYFIIKRSKCGGIDYFTLTHPQTPSQVAAPFIHFYPYKGHTKSSSRLVYVVVIQKLLWTMSRNRQTPTPATPSGSHVLEATENESAAQFPRILRLRAEDNNASSSRNNDEDASNRRIRWSEDVVDNEGMGKKKSKGNK